MVSYSTPNPHPSTVYQHMENSILIYGHFHVPFIKKIETNYYMNPGSISLPKEGNEPSYLIVEEKKATIYDIKDNIIQEESLN